MKKSRAFIALLLCAVVLICMAVPAFAFFWQDSDTVTLSWIGVTADCSASALRKKAMASITLTYLPDPSQHLPSNDYTPNVTFYITTTGHPQVTYCQTAQVGMSASFSQNVTEIITAVSTDFYVNSSNACCTINLP